MENGKRRYTRNGKGDSYRSLPVPKAGRAPGKLTFNTSPLSTASPLRNSPRPDRYYCDTEMSSGASQSGHGRLHFRSLGSVNYIYIYYTVRFDRNIYFPYNEPLLIGSLYSMAVFIISCSATRIQTSSDTYQASIHES